MADIRLNHLQIQQLRLESPLSIAFNFAPQRVKASSMPILSQFCVVRRMQILHNTLSNSVSRLMRRCFGSCRVARAKCADIRGLKIIPFAECRFSARLMNAAKNALSIRSIHLMTNLFWRAIQIFATSFLQSSFQWRSPVQILFAKRGMRSSRILLIHLAKKLSAQKM